MKNYENKTLLFEDLYSAFISATSPSDSMNVSIWEYKQELLSPKLIAHLSRLAERMMTIQHPNILGFRDYFNSDKSFATIHDTVEGYDSLETVLLTNKSIAFRWKVLIQCADAMKALEKEGLVWGGLNLNHIWVNSEGNVKLIKPVLPLSLFQVHLKRRPVVDHPEFLAPETIMQGRYDTQSDIYAFGVLGHHLLSGGWPFKSGDTLKSITASFLGKLTLIGGEGIPDRVKSLIYTCLRLSPSDRFESFKELMEKYEDKSVILESVNNETPEKMKALLEQNKKSKIFKKWRRAGVYLGYGLLGVALIWGTMKALDYIVNKDVPMLTIPNIKGFTSNDAMLALEQSGLRGSLAGYKQSEEIPSGSVVETKPPIGREVRANRDVRIYLSLGSGDTLVPNLVGKTLAESAHLLPQGATLNITQEVYSYTLEKGTIISQLPLPKSRTKAPIQVTVSGGFPITLSADPPHNGMITVVLYLGVLQDGPPQSVQVQNNDRSEVITLLEKTFAPGFQDTFSFQVKEHSEILVYYNKKLAFKDVVQ